MAHFARIVDGRVAAIEPLPGGINPTDAFPAAIADTLVACDGAVVEGSTWDGKTFTAPVLAAPVSIDLKAYAAAARYAKEIGGITVAGVKIATDRASQAMINGAQGMVALDANFSTSWKGADGTFTALNAGQITAIAQAVGTHVAGCFSAEAQVNRGVTAGTIRTASGVDAVFAGVTS
jgi:hypothetical protein